MATTENSECSGGGDSGGSEKEEERLLVIDCDCGLDDAQALMLALGSHGEEGRGRGGAVHQVLAVTCVAGNAGVHQVVRNVLKVLRVCGELGKVPVYAGCSASLLGTRADSSFYHGADGLGDAGVEEVPHPERYLEREGAPHALARLARERPGRVTLIALGPLTNVAMACRIDDGFAANLRDAYIMGGNYRGVGNVTCSAEYNFHSDPEAAYITLRELQCPVTLLTWELCIDNAVDMA